MHPAFNVLSYTNSADYVSTSTNQRHNHACQLEDTIPVFNSNRQDVLLESTQGLYTFKHTDT